MHGQGDLRKFSGHTAQRGDPHPEDRAGSAHGDRIGHADDVAVSHAGGQGGGERFVGADLPDALVGLLLHVPYDFPESGSETGELNSAEADGKVEPHAEKDDQHNGTEQKCTQFSEDFSNDCFHFLFSFAKKYRGTHLASSPVFASLPIQARLRQRRRKA